MMKVLVLLAPRWWGFKNSLIFGGQRALVKSGSLLVMALGFWAGIYVIFHRVLRYFQAVEEFGDLLAYKPRQRQSEFGGRNGAGLPMIGRP